MNYHSLQVILPISYYQLNINQFLAKRRQQIHAMDWIKGNMNILITVFRKFLMKIYHFIQLIDRLQKMRHIH